MSDVEFEQVSSALARGGVEAALEQLVATLRERKNYRDLFTARQMQIRHRMDLPVIDVGQLTDLPEPKRTELEEAYVEACREVGLLMLRESRVREAWMYLRISGDQAALREFLATATPTEENTSELIEIALYEGVSPQRGLELVLQSHGICNSITTLDGMVQGLSKADQAGSAGLLVRHLHQQLVDNVRADVARQQGSPPSEATLLGLVADRDWLLAEGNYHTDTSHLASIVRFARMADDADTLQLAVDLTEYGRRLHTQFQIAGEEPFADYYESHRQFLGALLAAKGEKSASNAAAVDAAAAYFRARAEATDIEEAGTAAIEFYISLLARVGRDDAAIDELARLIPPGVPTIGIAPHLWELVERSGRYERLSQISQDRGDLLGFSAGLAAHAKAR
jgi:hypothetical protein